MSEIQGSYVTTINGVDFYTDGYIHQGIKVEANIMFVDFSYDYDAISEQGVWNAPDTGTDNTVFASKPDGGCDFFTGKKHLSSRCRAYGVFGGIEIEHKDLFNTNLGPFVHSGGSSSKVLPNGQIEKVEHKPGTTQYPYVKVTITRYDQQGEQIGELTETNIADPELDADMGAGLAPHIYDDPDLKRVGGSTQDNDADDGGIPYAIDAQPYIPLITVLPLSLFLPIDINDLWNQFKNWTPPPRDPLAIDLDADGIETIAANGTILTEAGIASVNLSHSDVEAQESADAQIAMLVQIYGRKKLTLIPAFQVTHVYNDKHVYSASDFPEVDIERFPKMANVKPIEAMLSPGEAVFIPIGWWHCVESMDVSISISFTGFKVKNDFFKRFPRVKSY